MNELGIRLYRMERKIALLRGEPDPGMPCPGVVDSDCHGGKVKVWSDYGDWGWGDCPTCGGRMAVFPEIK